MALIWQQLDTSLNAHLNAHLDINLEARLDFRSHWLHILDCTSKDVRCWRSVGRCGAVFIEHTADLDVRDTQECAFQVLKDIAQKAGLFDGPKVICRILFLCSEFKAAATLSRLTREIEVQLVDIFHCLDMKFGHDFNPGGSTTNIQTIHRYIHVYIHGNNRRPLQNSLSNLIGGDAEVSQNCNLIDYSNINYNNSVAGISVMDIISENRQVVGSPLSSTTEVFLPMECSETSGTCTESTELVPTVVDRFNPVVDKMPVENYVDRFMRAAGRVARQLADWYWLCLE